jgi:HAE1 family hydrophobic/amphiphilic exporter-1
VLGVRRGALTVPAAAVQRGPEGTYVYTVGDDKSARIAKVGVAQIQDGLAVIDEGLSAGQRVVVDGQYKLRPGLKVAEARGRGQRGRPMSLSATFIRRPIGTSLLALAIFLVGAAVWPLLPVASLPQVDFPTILVSANLPGGSPETMASTVAQPLERQFSQIPGLAQMSSENTQGQTQITLQFDLSRNIDGAALDVQTAINAAAGQLPANLPSPPRFRKINPADFSILQLAVQSDTLPLTTVNEYADTILAQQISQLDGVGQVIVFGRRNRPCACRSTRPGWPRWA